MAIKRIRAWSDVVVALPHFSTRRLVVRPATFDDLDALWALWRDPQVRRYLFDNRQVTREGASELLSNCVALEPDQLGLWCVAVRGAPAIVGCVGLLKVTAAAQHEPELSGQVELIAALAPAYWGRGYAAETLRAVLGYAFDSLGLANLAAVSDEPNVASHRMLERAGFEFRRECPGPCHRLRIYELTPERFTAQRKCSDGDR